MGSQDCNFTFLVNYCLKSITYDMAQQLMSAEKDENSTDRVHTILVPVENKKDDKGQP